MSATSIAKEGLLQKAWRYLVFNPEYRNVTSNSKLETANPFFFGINPANSANEVVTEDTALKVAALYRANKILCDTVGSLPLNVYQKKENGSIEVEKSHPVNYLLEKEPNTLQTSFTFRETMQRSINIRGNAIAIIRRRRAIPESIEFVHIDQIEEAYVKSGKAAYKIRLDGDVRVYKGSDILHIPNQSKEGFWGQGILDVGQETIGGALASQRYSNSFLANNAQPSIALISKQRLEETQRQNNVASWKAAHGKGKQGGTAVLDGDWAIQQLSITPEQAQMLETKKFTVVDIARLFGVEPHLLFDLERATFSNIEHQGIEYVTYTIRGIVKRWEQELNRKLFTEEEKRSGKYFCKFNLNGLLRADAKSRAEYYKSLFEIAGIKPTEIRTLEGMNIDDAIDEYFIASNNFTRVSDLGKENQNVE